MWFCRSGAAHTVCLFGQVFLIKFLHLIFWGLINVPPFSAIHTQFFSAFVIHFFGDSKYAKNILKLNIPLGI
jgi:uncharacterized membrane protein YiaA